MIGPRPTVSVVTVNYNGAALLEPLLESLGRQSHPPLEVLVVDNASTDGSKELVRGAFPEVRWIGLPRNRGFTGGNNVGIGAARGDLVALVNNDTVLHPDWLRHLVDEAVRDPEIAAVAPKILFFRPYLPIHLSVDTFCPAEVAGRPDARQLGAMVGEESRFTGCDYDKPVFHEGFQPRESVDGRAVRWSGAEATLLLPFGPDDGTRLELVASGSSLAPDRRIRVSVGGRAIDAWRLGSRLRTRRIRLEHEIVRAHAIDVLNNTGSSLDRHGNAADRGIHEPDLGQYDRRQEIDAFCGAAVLLRRSALDRVGLFDRHFFMYYEDTDLSWRLRRHGYRLWYQPASRVRHHHATTSGEFSPLFVFYTVRNKILMVAKNGSLPALARLAARELRHLVRLLAQAGRPGGGAELRSLARRELATRLRVELSLSIQLPLALAKRWGWSRH